MQTDSTEFVTGNASLQYSYGNGTITRLEASIGCPREAVLGSSFLQSSQNGLCSCSAALFDVSNGMDKIPISFEDDGAAAGLECECYFCDTEQDPGLNRFEFSCNRPVIRTCTSYNCAGGCNDVLFHYRNDTTFANETVPPPTDDTDSFQTPAAVLVTETTANFNFGGIVTILNANLVCPRDIVRASSFLEASQANQCTCANATLLAPTTIANNPLDPSVLTESIECDCFLCPDDNPDYSNVEYRCNKAIAGTCTSFNCNRECNGTLVQVQNSGQSSAAPTGNLDSMPSMTMPPTGNPTASQSPTSQPSSSPSSVAPSTTTTTFGPTMVPSSMPATPLEATKSPVGISNVEESSARAKQYLGSTSCSTVSILLCMLVWQSIFG